MASSFANSFTSSSSSSFLQPPSPCFLHTTTLLPSFTHHIKIRRVESLKKKNPPLTNKSRASIHHLCHEDKEEEGKEILDLEIVESKGHLKAILDSISLMYGMEDNVELTNLLEGALRLDDRGRLAEDYRQRANIFERIGKVVEEMHKVEEVVMEEDNGRAPHDYLIRSHFFTLSAQLFTTN